MTQALNNRGLYSSIINTNKTNQYLPHMLIIFLFFLFYPVFRELAVPIPNMFGY